MATYRQLENNQLKSITFLFGFPLTHLAPCQKKKKKKTGPAAQRPPRTWMMRRTASMEAGRAPSICIFVEQARPTTTASSGDLISSSYSRSHFPAGLASPPGCTDRRMAFLPWNKNTQDHPPLHANLHQQMMIWPLHAVE